MSKEPESEYVGFSISDKDAVEKYIDLGRECRLATMDYYPDKINVEWFARAIKSTIDAFVDNTNNLGSEPEFRWVEDWMEEFQAWSEMEKGNFD